VERQQAETPLKVCPHCSVASRTDADVCPSCGKPYARRGLHRLPAQWRWWYAIPIVAAAFAIGYFGISKLIDDGDEPEGYITVEQAAAVPDDVTPSELEDQLDGEQPVDIRPQRGSKEITCSYYGITGQARSVWAFCFEGERLVRSAPLGGQAAPVSPQGAPGAAPQP
jgi:hypothetical protein